MGMAFVALSVNVNNGGHRIVVRFGSVDWTQGRQTPGLDRFLGFAKCDVVAPIEFADELASASRVSLAVEFNVVVLTNQISKSHFTASLSLLHSRISSIQGLLSHLRHT